jgi:energy-coupling factor transporter transmembrane protein EcfT
MRSKDEPVMGAQATPPHTATPVLTALSLAAQVLVAFVTLVMGIWLIGVFWVVALTQAVVGVGVIAWWAPRKHGAMVLLVPAVSLGLTVGLIKMADTIHWNNGPPPVEVHVSIKDASNTCITHQTEKEKLATCSDLEFIDLDGDAKMRIFDESGRKIGESGMPNTSGWQDGKLIPGWSFSAVTEPTTSRTLTITAHGCDLNGSRRGQAVVVKPTGSKLAEGKGPTGRISPHTQVELSLEVVDDPHTGQMRCLAATRHPRHHPLDER